MNKYGRLTPAALWAVALVLAQFANGTIETSFTPHLPGIAEHLGLGDGSLGTILAALPLGLLVGSLAGGPLCKRLGSRAVVVVGGVVFFASLPFTVLAGTPELLALTLFVGGVGNGMFDTAWTLQSTDRARQLPGRQHHQVMSAMFSLGSLVAVGAALLVLHAGLDPWSHLMVVAGLAVAFVVGGARFLADDPRHDAEPAPVVSAGGDVDPAAHVDGRRSTFAMLCVASFVTFFPLGAAYSWSTPYLHELGAEAWIAPLGLVAYTACELVGRLLAFRFSDRFSPVRIVVAGSVTALAGGLLIVVPGDVTLAVVGWGLVALGVSPAGPTWQTAANNSAETGNRQVRIGVLTSVSYVGGMIGLPVVGWVAEATSLRVALGLVALCSALLLLFARSARAAHPSGHTAR